MQMRTPFTQVNKGENPAPRTSSSARVSAFKWTKWNDSERVDVLVRPEVMRLHMMPMASFSDAFLVDHSLNKCLKVRIIDDPTKVALEVDDVHQIKPRKRGEQTDVGLGKNLCLMRTTRETFSHPPKSAFQA